MKRMIFGGMLVVSFIFLHPASAPRAEEKKLGPWKVVNGVKLLKVWEVPEFGLQWPQVVFLQLSADQLKELRDDQLSFYKKYDVFGATLCTRAVAHFEVSLVSPNEKTKDPALVVANHDWSTACSFSALDVTKIAP